MRIIFNKVLDFLFGLAYTNYCKENEIENNFQNSAEVVNMMPLTMVRTGEAQVIRKIGGNEETKRFLENLGFVTGAVVTVVSTISGNMIVNVKDSRIAVNQDMAKKIMV